ncbi:MAG: glycosyltransferase family 4 protein [Pseudomonadota bacterium]
MRIAWITRSFLDYRVPVFAALDRLVGGTLSVTFNGDYVPVSVTAKTMHCLGARAHPLYGELRLGGEDQHHLANRNLSLRFQPGLGRHIRALNPDVLVCDGFFKWTLPALVDRLRRGTPLVILYERTAHTERHAQAIRTRFRRAVIRVTDAMGCSGRLCQAYSESLGMPAERITRGHMSADTAGLQRAVAALPEGQRAETRARLGLAGRVFLYVGRIDQRKGCRALIEAWRRARFASDEATLLMVGDGPDLPALRAAAPADVVCTGRLPYSALPEYYAAADAFVIATLEDNWSLVVPEAMACGLPVLSSIYNGCWPELVRPGENGWTFDPTDQAGFAQTLRTAQITGPRLAEMGQRSREIVADYGPEAAARSIKDACTIALARRRGNLAA